MFFSDITSSRQPSRAATHALRFVLYRLRTPGIIVYLVNAVLAMGDKVIGVRLERDDSRAEYRQRWLACLHPIMGIVVGIVWG